jgi:hypothetical protein
LLSCVATSASARGEALAPSFFASSRHTSSRSPFQFLQVPPGSRVAVVDLYSASFGRQGLVTIERRLGMEGPFNFDIHPTNVGHFFIAREFEAVWIGVP